MSVSAASPTLSRLGVRAPAVLVAAHGTAHFVGTSRAFANAASGDSAAYLGGAWSISDPSSLRALGVLWAVAGAATIAAAVVLWTRRPSWPLVLGAVSLASLVLVVLGLWGSVIGLPIDIALVAVAGAALHRRRHATR